MPSNSASRQTNHEQKQRRAAKLPEWQRKLVFRFFRSFCASSRASRKVWRKADKRLRPLETLPSIIKAIKSESKSCRGMRCLFSNQCREKVPSLYLSQHKETSRLSDPSNKSSPRKTRWKKLIVQIWNKLNAKRATLFGAIMNKTCDLRQRFSSLCHWTLCGVSRREECGEAWEREKCNRSL